jgi:hypothetical protein
MNFVKTFTNSLGESMCKEIISIFENNQELQFPGSTLIPDDINQNVKKTTDVHSCVLQTNQKWMLLEPLLRNELTVKLERYFYELNNTTFVSNPPSIMSDKGFQIQKYNANDGFYKFHHDFNMECGRSRCLTYLWYLNDVTEGGETEFYEGTKIIPETGKLLIFPSTWTYVHRGNMPISNDKYIMTGWIYGM